ncbi:F0F1 ATP synthase subunit delta [Arsenophonus endosymbiont of Aphis craccivora]|uniref:F0F1 ATP synthase subunit delta n=1 Tax=Arsenophonus endosymbiont of Aphis craccivora TaxID=1231049 RepID=UPI0015DC1A1F|nr:F0F1 ATP synthase subunit delta [Arsenophonus endosymbiont of Aphis craccivora]QLK87515.1 F0F1 ATP synthase subunit delta [Arsenophonus endosymbiont of Aphis craccivora]
MSEITTVARPYAKAAFDFAVENQLVDKWQNMLSFIAEATSNQQIGELLSGSIAPETLAKTFITICGDEIDEHVRHLIRIMAENGRLSTLPEVLKQFIQLRAFLESTVDIEVISATELNEKQQFKISAAMEKRLSRKVKLNCKIDKSVIAGVIIRAGDLVIDGSVRGRIERLTDVLQS